MDSLSKAIQMSYSQSKYAISKPKSIQSNQLNITTYRVGNLKLHHQALLATFNLHNRYYQIELQLTIALKSSFSIDQSNTCEFAIILSLCEDLGIVMKPCCTLHLIINCAAVFLYLLNIFILTIHTNRS